MEREPKSRVLAIPSPETLISEMVKFGVCHWPLVANITLNFVKVGPMAIPTNPPELTTEDVVCGSKSVHVFIPLLWVQAAWLGAGPARKPIRVKALATPTRRESFTVELAERIKIKRASVAQAYCLNRS